MLYLTLPPHPPLGFYVLIEGSHYKNVWLETQPMGGAMYGVRNLRVALNNQLIFIRTQRADGRLPGVISRVGSTGSGIINPSFSYPGRSNLSMLQGFYMASPAVDVAFLMNISNSDTSLVTAYLDELRPALERFVSWIWSERNSSSGMLWLNTTADTGEDGSDKYTPIPSNNITPPFESMDMQGYAFDAERALARIARLQGNTSAVEAWTARMETTAAALNVRLWREEEGAAFDRERDGAQQYVSTLVHNNLRAMWHGVYSQSMADAFIARHLMNSSEFWTPTPLTSISAADPRFKDVDGNNWSGPSEGLTFQRAIRALTFYGHHAELLLIGERQKFALSKTMQFPQQINPFTSQPDKGDCYGPMLLSLLENTALTTGIAVRAEPPTLLWSSFAINTTTMTPTFVFTQTLGTSVYQLEGFTNGTFVGQLNGVYLFSVVGGQGRIVTGLDGVVIGVIGASSFTETLQLSIPNVIQPIILTVAPNEEWSIMGNATPTRTRQVPFSPPF